ncbi:MAG: serine/threonine-protein kinase [Pseudomonadota bacterium]
MNQLATTEKAYPVTGFSDELKPGTTLLQGQYKIETYLNSGGFGITYLARDSLDRVVVIKECFPGSFCRRSDTIVRPRSRSHGKEFRSIVKLFVQEARNLARLQHPGIVGVHQVFEDNDTAYMALDFIDGRDLLDIIEDQEEPFSAEEVKDLLLKLLDAIGFVHENNLLHRDISPDNILMDGRGNPVLIDFGAAREEATRASRALSTMLVVKDGYSPQEFYIAGSTQNPSSDLYALGATFYHIIAGEVPPNSQMRLAAVAAAEEDPYIPLTAYHLPGFDDSFLESIDKALSVLPRDRFENAQEWIDHICKSQRRLELLEQARSDDSIQQTVTNLVASTNRQIEKVIAAGDSSEPLEKSRRGRAVSRRNLTRPVKQVVIPPDPYEDDDGTPIPVHEEPAPAEADVADAPKRKAYRAGDGLSDAAYADPNMNIYELSLEDAPQQRRARGQRLVRIGLTLVLVIGGVTVASLAGIFPLNNLF